MFINRLNQKLSCGVGHQDNTRDPATGKLTGVQDQPETDREKMGRSMAKEVAQPTALSSMRKAAGAILVVAAGCNRASHLPMASKN